MAPLLLLEAVLLVDHSVHGQRINENQNDVDRDRKLTGQLVAEREAGKDSNLVQRGREGRMKVRHCKPDDEERDDESPLLAPVGFESARLYLPAAFRHELPALTTLPCAGRHPETDVRPPSPRRLGHRIVRSAVHLLSG